MSMILALKVILFTHVVLLGYTWGGYQILLAMLATTRKRSQSRSGILPDAVPPSTISPAAMQSFGAGNHQPSTSPPHISIIIAAFNEESVIAERIQNLKNLNYPPEKITVYIGCDGCTDTTASIAKNATADDPHFHILDFKQNRGKVSVLRKLVAKAADNPDASGTLLVFSDANTMFAPDALLKLSAHFVDENIGGVCGRLAFVSKDETSENPAEEGAYWKLETKLKTWESTLGSCLGANGAIYAIRPQLFWQEIPENTIVDDLVIGMKVREQGFRMIYDPTAIATEILPEVGDEWTRRVRIGTGDYQAAVLCKACLHPRFGWFAWSFWSHKILRWLTPHMAMITIIASYALTAISLLNKDFSITALLTYTVAIGITALLAAGHIGNMIQTRQNRLTKICAICNHFVTMHAALFIGFIRFCNGNMQGTWKRTPRKKI